MAVPNKRLIFTASTGRCGTAFLAHLLRTLPDVQCFHEPAPSFAEVMRAAQTDPYAARRFWLASKLPAIERLSQPTYIETSHLFCKGFAEPLLELDVRFDLILLQRRRRDVALSLYRLNTIPGRTEQGCRYYLSPDDPGVMSLPGWRDRHDYQLCYWYCLEIARRQQLYAAAVRQRGGQVVSVTLDGLTRGGLAGQLVRMLGLQPARGWGRLRWLLAKNRVVNRRRPRRKVEPNLNLDALEGDVQRAVDWNPAAA